MFVIGSRIAIIVSARKEAETNVVIAPAAINALATVAAPSVVTSGVAVAPAAINALAQVVNPTVRITGRYSLRFYGNGSENIDRVRIPLDTGGTSTPVDVGAGDFTIECWIKFDRADNTANITGGGDSRNSNIFWDRDIWGHPRGWTVGLTQSGASNTFVCFGMAESGGGWATIIGTTNVATGDWNHVALTFEQSTRRVTLWVRGNNDATRIYDQSNLSYPDGYDPGAGQNNPYLVLGAEKHDAGSSYPSYDGYMCELRISNTRRYTANFTPATWPFSPDANAVGLYHFDDGSGTVLTDYATVSGAPTNGALLVGGSPSGPAWSTDWPFGSVGVGPAAINALGQVANPSVVLGGLSLGPGALNALAQVVNPDVVLSGLALSPTAVNALAQVVNPGAVLSGLNLTPEALNALAQVLNPGAVLSGLNLTPGAVNALAQVVNPGVVLSGLALSPAALNALALVVNPAAVLSGLSLTPAALDALALVAGPDITAGGDVAVTPGAVNALAQVVNPDVVLSGLALSPTALNALAQVVNPAVVLSGLSLTPAALNALALVVSPTVTVAGSVSVTPAGVNALAVVVNPSVTGGFIAIIMLTLKARSTRLSLKIRSTRLTIKER